MPPPTSAHDVRHLDYVTSNPPDAWLRRVTRLRRLWYSCPYGVRANPTPALDVRVGAHALGGGEMRCRRRGRGRSRALCGRNVDGV